MYDLEKNLEYLLISFFTLGCLSYIPTIYAFMADKLQNPLMIYGGTALATVLLVCANVFNVKYWVIPLNIRVGKLLNKII